jgi:hypothetical protein
MIRIGRCLCHEQGKIGTERKHFPVQRCGMDGFDRPWSRGARLQSMKRAATWPPINFTTLTEASAGGGATTPSARVLRWVSANRLQMRRRTYGRWHGGDRFQNPGSDLVGVAPANSDGGLRDSLCSRSLETVRYADWCASVSDFSK